MKFFQTVCFFFILTSSAYAQTLLVYQSSKTKYGYKFKHTKEVAIKGKFDKAFPFQGEVARVVKKGKWGLINRKGKYVKKPVFSYIFPFNTFGVARFCKNTDEYGLSGAWGIINKDGKVVVDAKYTFISSFSDLGVAKVVEGGFRKDVGDVKYSKLVEGEKAYEILDIEKFGVSAELKDATIKWLEEDEGYVDEVIPFSYWQGGKWGLVNAKGEEVIHLEYDQMGELPSKEDTSFKQVVKACKDCVVSEVEKDQMGNPLWEGGKQGYLNVHTGEEFIALAYGMIDEYIDYAMEESLAPHQYVVSDGTRRFMVDDLKGLAYWVGSGKVGIVDAVTGKEIVPVQYDELVPYGNAEIVDESLLAVGKTDLRNNQVDYGLVDREGKMVVDYNTDYDRISPFYENYFLVQDYVNNKVGVLDSSGKVLFPLQYDIIKWQKDTGLWQVSNNGKYQLYDQEGKLLTEAVFDKLVFHKEGFCGFSENQWKAYGVDGRQVQESKCEELSESSSVK